MIQEQLFRPPGIPENWRYFCGRVQLGPWVIPYDGWVPEWAAERLEGSQPPMIRRPGVLCVALLASGLSHESAELLCGYGDELARPWVGCFEQDIQRIEARTARTYARMRQLAVN